MPSRPTLKMHGFRRGARPCALTAPPHAKKRARHASPRPFYILCFPCPLCVFCGFPPCFQNARVFSQGCRAAPTQGGMPSRPTLKMHGFCRGARPCAPLVCSDASPLSKAATCCRTPKRRARHASPLPCNLLCFLCFLCVFCGFPPCFQNARVFSQGCRAAPTGRDGIPPYPQNARFL